MMNFTLHDKKCKSLLQKCVVIIYEENYACG